MICAFLRFPAFSLCPWLIFKMFCNNLATAHDFPEPVDPTPGGDSDGSTIDVLPQDEGLSTGAKVGIALGVVGATAVATGAFFFFFTGTAEVDGVAQLVIVGKKTAEEASVMTFRGKKYKIKRKNLKIRRKSKDDEVDENGNPKKKKKIKIPIFLLKK